MLADVLLNREPSVHNRHRSLIAKAVNVHPWGIWQNFRLGDTRRDGIMRDR